MSFFEGIYTKDVRIYQFHNTYIEFLDKKRELRLTKFSF